MQKPSLQPQDVAVLTSVLDYWATNWDWECPTLFGLEIDEYRSAIDRWRIQLDMADPSVAFAILGALREFLYGASAVNNANAEKVTGMSRAQVLTLEQKVGSFIHGIVDAQARPNKSLERTRGE